MRREHDLLGDRDVPASAYYGVHTLRAVEDSVVLLTAVTDVRERAPRAVAAGARA